MAYYAPFYRPNYYSPMQQNQQEMIPQYSQQQHPMPPAQQNGNGLIWVQGETGAKSFIVAPGQTVMLMDSEGDTFYLKTADSSGMPMPLRIFDYKERTDAAIQANNVPVSGFQQASGDYVTREEFERRMAEMAAGCKCRAKAKEKAVNGGDEDGE